MMTGGGGGNTLEQWASCCFDLKCSEGSIKLRQRLISNERVILKVLIASYWGGELSSELTLFLSLYLWSTWGVVLYCSVLTGAHWSSLDLSFSVSHQMWDLLTIELQVFIFYLTSLRSQVSGQALHLQFCLVSCGLCRGEGRSANMQAVAANYNQLDPPPPRHGVNLEFHWAAE